MEPEKDLDIGQRQEDGGDGGLKMPQYDEQKGIHNLHPDDDVELQNGRLVELEVDLSRVIAEEEEQEGDWDADTSPFTAVRAVVPETDDTGMPVNTLRAWLLGIVRLVQNRAYNSKANNLTSPFHALRSSFSWAPVSISSSVCVIQAST